MTDKLENYLVENSINFKRKESKWYNSNANFPLIEIQLLEKKSEIDIFHNFEFRKSEFSKPNFINNNDSLTSRIIVKSEIILKNKSLSDFQIEKSSYFINLLKGNSSFKITSKNQYLKKLLNNKEMKYLFEMFSDDPEFEPIIKGVNFDDKFKISINFQCRNIDGKYIEIINKISDNINQQ